MSDPQSAFPESEYRSQIQKIYAALDRALESVDPDLIEGEGSLGSYSLTFSDRSRCILSAQPSVRQLWLALASKGIAHHFNWDAQKQQWWDDKAKGIELLAFLGQLISAQVGKELRLS